MAQDWLTHTFQRARWQPQSQVTALIVLTILITLVFGGLYLSQVANFATTNRSIEDLIAQRDQLERANEQLRANIAGLETVPRLLDRAQALGFRAATAADIQYLVVAGYDPERDLNQAVIQTDEDIADAPVYDQTFAGWLQQQFDILRSQFESFGR